MPRRIVGAVIAGVVLLLVVANVHLVYVAVISQPDCVAHPQGAYGTSGAFRAAKPAC